jgi:ABC-type bacteriocin/lantibiotic exporter with double-glycine peptidase domain
LFYQRVLGIKDFLSECFRTGAGISCFLLGISVLLWVMDYGLCLLSLLTICLLILLKFAIDAVLIHKSHSFLTTTKMQYLILSSLFYPFSVSVVSYSLIGKYEWKGRRF